MERVPEYFAEKVIGTVWRQEDVAGLTIEPLTPPKDVEIILRGEIILRYGIAMLYAPHTLVPGLFETERGAIMVGREAWDYIWQKFQLYPRAEVMGVQDDGEETTVLMRELDFGEPPQVLAYKDELAARAAATIQQLDAPDGVELPELLRQSLR